MRVCIVIITANGTTTTTTNTTTTTINYGYSYEDVKNRGMFRSIPVTEGISTTDIVGTLRGASGSGS